MRTILILFNPLKLNFTNRKVAMAIRLDELYADFCCLGIL